MNEQEEILEMLDREADVSWNVLDEDMTIKTILGHSGEIIVVVKRGSVTDAISLEGLIQAAVIGWPSTVEVYRTALKNLSLELLEWSVEK